MNKRLHDLRGIGNNPEKIRRWIKREGGTITRERKHPHHAQKWNQYHVVAGNEYWIFEPSTVHGYQWQKVRDECRCGKSLCECG